MVFGWFWGRRPPKPGRLGVPKLVQEVYIMALKYTVSLPAPGAGDVASRELSIAVDGGNPTVQTLDGKATEATVLVERDQNVALTLVDIDGSGNRSAASNPLAFKAVDTIPPPQPGGPDASGGMSIASVEQTD